MHARAQCAHARALENAVTQPHAREPVSAFLMFEYYVKRINNFRLGLIVTQNLIIDLGE